MIDNQGVLTDTGEAVLAFSLFIISMAIYGIANYYVAKLNNCHPINIISLLGFVLILIACFIWTTITYFFEVRWTW